MQKESIIPVQVCGVDDAGRGSLLGPLVIAGVSLPRSRTAELTRMGVKDSKKLSPDTRNTLYKKIIRLADGYCVVRINPYTIDQSVKKHQLNCLEAKYMARVVSKLCAGVSYVDSCDVNPARFGREISRLSNQSKIRSYHHADDRFAIVSAASIIAKVCRDREIEKLRKTHNVGSGYPSDPKTIRFVKRYHKKHRKMPGFVRKSWRPVREITARTLR